jgi:hypothetical protein
LGEVLLCVAPRGVFLFTAVGRWRVFTADC